MSKTIDIELGKSNAIISKITKSTTKTPLESSNTHIHNQGIKQHPTTQQFDSSEYNERRKFFKDQTNNSNTSMHSISTSPLTTRQININTKTDSEIYAERRQFFHNRITNHNSMVTTSTITLPTSSETKGAVIVSCLLVFCTVFGMCTWFSAGAVLSQLKILWNIDDSSATLLTLGVNFGFLIGALLSVHFNLADKYPPSKLISIGAIGAAVLNVGLLLPNVGFGVALLLRVGTGSFMALVYPMAVKVAASHFIDNRGIAVGFVVGSVGLGSASPHLVTALMGDQLSWQYLLVTTSLLSFVAGIVSLCFLTEGPYVASKKKTKKEMKVKTEKTSIENKEERNKLIKKKKNQYLLPKS